MGDLAIALRSSARRAWLDQDFGIAADMKSGDDLLDGCSRQRVAHVLAQQGPGAPGPGLHAHAVGRNLERIADHAVIIGDRVSYILTGDPTAHAAEIG